MRSLRLLLPALLLTALVGARRRRRSSAARHLDHRLSPPGPGSWASSGGATYSCGGSIRDATHIVTAAHCVYIDGNLLAPAKLAWATEPAPPHAAGPSLRGHDPIAVPQRRSYDVALLDSGRAARRLRRHEGATHTAGLGGHLATGVGSRGDAVATGWGATSERGSGRFDAQARWRCPCAPTSSARPSPSTTPTIVGDRSVCAGGTAWPRTATPTPARATAAARSRSTAEPGWNWWASRATATGAAGRLFTAALHRGLRRRDRRVIEHGSSASTLEGLDRDPPLRPPGRRPRDPRCRDGTRPARAGRGHARPRSGPRPRSPSSPAPRSAGAPSAFTAADTGGQVAKVQPPSAQGPALPRQGRGPRTAAPQPQERSEAQARSAAGSPSPSRWPRPATGSTRWPPTPPATARGR